MMYLKMILTVIALLIFIPMSLYAQAIDDEGSASMHQTLSVSFEDNFLSSYNLDLPKDQNYVLSQSYSWIRDNGSRYNLIGYTVDNGNLIQIPRIPRGNFTLDIAMNTSHNVVFFAIPQYSVAVKGVSEYTFLPQSATSDNWFDPESKITIMVPYVIESDDGKTRQYLEGWSLNNGQQERIQLQENGIFNTPQITISDVNNIQFITTTQHKVDIVSDYGTFEDQGWYDSGNTATILISPPHEYLVSHTIEGIDGQNAKLNGNTIQVLVDKPKTILVKWSTNYLPLLAIILIGLGVIVLFLIRTRRTAVKTQEIHTNNTSSEDYDNVLDHYRVSKLIEKLDSYKEDGLLDEQTHLKIKEMIEK